MMALSLRKNWKDYGEVLEFNPQICEKGMMLAQFLAMPELQSQILESQ